MKEYALWNSIPKLMDPGTYECDMGWVDMYEKNKSGDWLLDIDPEYQRGHVWTEEQKRRYVEFCLRGGKSGRNIYLNSVGFRSGRARNIEVVDGKQRVTAVFDFIEGRVRPFGYAFSEFDGFPIINLSVTFKLHVAELGRVDVMRWYVELNEGATAHTENEISRVKALIADAQVERGDG